MASWPHRFLWGPIVGSARTQTVALIPLPVAERVGRLTDFPLAQDPARPPPRTLTRLSGALQCAKVGMATLPQFFYHMKPRPHAEVVDYALGQGASPFSLVDTYINGHDAANLSRSAKSAWTVYSAMCTRFGRDALPLTVASLSGFILGYVREKGNSSANLSSEMSHLRAYARSRCPPLAWPDFEKERGETMAKLIARIQKDWPAEISPAPALTYAAGLSRTIQYLETLPQNLWTMQWLAILSLLHALVLRPSDIIPPDDFPVAEGTTSGFHFPRRGDFTFVGRDVAPPYGELHFYNPLHKTNKRVVDRRNCMPATCGLGGKAIVDAMRALRQYLESASLWVSPAHAPVFFYRNRDGSLRDRMSRAVLLRELRLHVLAPAGVPDSQLCSFRPGGATDLRAAGVPKDVVHTVGKWKTAAGMAPYDRANSYFLQGLAPFRESLISRQ